MKILVTSTLMLLLSLNTMAQTRNPRIKLTVTLENFVKATPIGTAIYNDVVDKYRSFNYVYGCTTGDIEKYPCEHKKAYTRVGSALVIHPDLHTASNEYLAWIMIQGMTKMVLDKRYRLDNFPRLKVVEIEQMVMLSAQRFWNELNPPLTRDLDLYSTSTDNIGYNLDLSVLSFSRAYEFKPIVNFYNKVALRSLRYDGIYLSVSDVVENDIFTDKEKEIAKFILDDFEQAL